MVQWWNAQIRRFGKYVQRLGLTTTPTTPTQYHQRMMEWTRKHGIYEHCSKSSNQEVRSNYKEYPSCTFEKKIQSKQTENPVARTNQVGVKMTLIPCSASV